MWKQNVTEYILLSNYDIQIKGIQPCKCIRPIDWCPNNMGNTEAEVNDSWIVKAREAIAFERENNWSMQTTKVNEKLQQMIANQYTTNEDIIEK